LARIWDAEEVVEADKARALIAGQFPDIDAAHLERLGVGFDNTAYLVDGAYVFRFPRRRVAVAPLTTESAVLPKLAGRLPLATPLPLWVGVPADGYPWPFAGYRYLAGRTACSADLDESQRAKATGVLARFLRTLHGLPAAGCSLPGETLGRLDIARRLPKALEFLQEVVALGYWEDGTEIAGILSSAETLNSAKMLNSSGLVAGQAPAPAIVHGDLYSRHLLVNAAGELEAVIDWGDIHLGDRALDLSVAWSFLPRRCHEEFRREYGEIDERTWLLARFRALYVSLVLISYGHDRGDEALVRAGQQSLRYMTDA